MVRPSLAKVISGVTWKIDHHHSRSQWGDVVNKERPGWDGWSHDSDSCGFQGRPTFLESFMPAETLPAWTEDKRKRERKKGKWLHFWDSTG